MLNQEEQAYADQEKLRQVADTVVETVIGYNPNTTGYVQVRSVSISFTRGVAFASVSLKATKRIDPQQYFEK